MGLKYTPSFSSGEHFADGRQSRLDFRWVMRVVVDEYDPARNLDHFEPPLQPAKRREPLGNRLSRRAGLESQRRRGEGVQHAVTTGRFECDFGQRLSSAKDSETIVSLSVTKLIRPPDQSAAEVEHVDVVVTAAILKKAADSQKRQGPGITNAVRGGHPPTQLRCR